MSDDIDFDAAADVQAAIEAAGGTVRDFETEVTQKRSSGALAAMMDAFGGNTERRYRFDVVITGPTSRDVDVDSADADIEDALRGLAVAQTVAANDDMDALAADIEGVYDRLADVYAGEAHPADEQEAFQTEEATDD